MNKFFFVFLLFLAIPASASTLVSKDVQDRLDRTKQYQQERSQEMKNTLKDIEKYWKKRLIVPKGVRIPKKNIRIR